MANGKRAALNWASDLAQVKRHLPTALVSEAAYRRLRKVAAFLPRASGGFECRLGAGEDRVDLSVLIGRQDSFRAILAGRERRAGAASCGGASLPKALWVHPVWRRLRRFCRLWGRADCPWRRDLALLWLEFDVPGANASARGPAGVPVPRFFLQLNRREARGTGKPAFWRRGARSRRKVEQMIRVLSGRRLPTPTRAALDDLMGRLPADSRIRFVGLWPDEPILRLRIELSFMGRSRLGAALGPNRRFAPILERNGLIKLFATPLDEIHVGLDVGPAASAGIGIQQFAHRGSPQRKFLLGTAALLDQLIRRGLCDDRKRRALLAWSGLMPDKHKGRGVFLPPEEDASELGIGPVPVLVRKVSHIKVSCASDGRMRAKAYFGIRHEVVQLVRGD